MTGVPNYMDMTSADFAGLYQCNSPPSAPSVSANPFANDGWFVGPVSFASPSGGAVMGHPYPLTCMAPRPASAPEREAPPSLPRSLRAPESASQKERRLRGHVSARYAQGHERQVGTRFIQFLAGKKQPADLARDIAKLQATLRAGRSWRLRWASGKLAGARLCTEPPLVLTTRGFMREWQDQESVHPKYSHVVALQPGDFVEFDGTDSLENFEISLRCELTALRAQLSKRTPGGADPVQVFRRSPKGA